MGAGVTSLSTNQPSAAQSGPPFTAVSAENGLSVSPLLKRIVLGNDVGDAAKPAVLFSDREIPAFGVSTKRTWFYTSGNIKLGDTGNVNDLTQRLQVIGNFRLNTFVQATDGNNLFINQLASGVPTGLVSANASGNVCIGAATGAALTVGTRNVFIGITIGNLATVAEANVGICSNALQRLTFGTGNIAIGNDSLSALTTGIDNIQIGRNANNSGITSGLENTLIGVNTNFTGTLKTAKQNILIGYQVDAMADVDGQINIANIIYGTGCVGQFLDNTKGKLGIGEQNPQQKLHVAGYGRFVGDTLGALEVWAESQNIRIQNLSGSVSCGVIGRDTTTSGLFIQCLTAGLTIDPTAGNDVTQTRGNYIMPGSSGNSIKMTSGIAAPSTTAAGAVTNRYGGATNFLGDPVAWMLVNIAGVDRKVPCY